jgi:predicted ATPase
MKLNVITGGPGVGKTSVLEALSKRGFNYIPEAARFLIGQGIQFGSDFQEMLVKTQILWEDKIDAVFADRGVIDGIGYCNHFGIELPRNLPNNLKNRYSRVFVLDPLSSYVNDDARRESKEESRAVHSSIIRAYTNLGYEPNICPAVSIEERTDIITKELEIERERKF